MGEVTGPVIHEHSVLLVLEQLEERVDLALVSASKEVMKASQHLALVLASKEVMEATPQASQTLDTPASSALVLE